MRELQIEVHRGRPLADSDAAARRLTKLARLTRADRTQSCRMPDDRLRSDGSREESSGNGLLTRLELIIGTILADFFGFNIQQIKIEARWTGIGRTLAFWIGPA